MTPDQKEKGIMQSDILASHLPKALLQKLHRSFLQFGFWLLQISVKRSQAEDKKPSRREQIQENSRYGLQRNNLPGNRKSRWLSAEKNLLASSHSWRDYQIFQVSIATKQVTPKLGGLHNHLFGIGIHNLGRSWWGQLISSPRGLTGVG